MQAEKDGTNTNKKVKTFSVAEILAKKQAEEEEKKNK